MNVIAPHYAAWSPRRAPGAAVPTAAARGVRHGQWPAPAPQGVVVFAVSGAFDSARCAGMSEELRRLCQGDGDVTLDLSCTDHLDGSGVGAIGFLFRRLTAGGRRLMVAGAAGQPRDLLTRLGLAAWLEPQEDGRRDR